MLTNVYHHNTSMLPHLYILVRKINKRRHVSQPPSLSPSYCFPQANDLNTIVIKQWRKMSTFL